MRDDDRQSRLFFFSGPGCVCTRAWQVDTVNSSAILLTSLASNGAVHVRGGVLKFTLVVDNDRQCTMHIHAQLPSVPQS